MTRPTLVHTAGALACAFVLASPFLARPAHAAPQVVYSAGQWTAFSDTTADHQPVCGIATTGAEGRRIAIQQQAGQTGLLMLLDKASWSIPSGTPIDVAVQVDGGDAMPMKGTGAGNQVTLDISFQESVTLMRAIRAGRQIRVYFPAGNEPMWSGGLNGTGAVINAFNGCRAAFPPPPPTQPYQPSPGQPAAPAPAAPPPTQPFTPPPAPHT